jgi:glycosyltransferase involved in cell wall biosynthesis
MVTLSILIISQGREELLKKCLDSLNPPLDNWEIIIVANGCTISEEFKTKATVLESQVALTPGAARNIGIKEAKGKWILFLAEESYLSKTYWEIVLPLLENPKIDVFGGPTLAAKGMKVLSQSLAIALSSPFCTGMTFARYQGLGKKLITADETKLSHANLWIKKELLEERTYPEDYLHGEEILLLQELKAMGCSLFYHPKLMTYLFHQSSVRDYYWEGFYRSRILRKKIGVGNQVYWLPAIFVLLHFLIFIDSFLWLSLAKLYAGVIIFISLGLSSRYTNKWWLFPLVSIQHYLVVFFYGLGFLSERVKLNLIKQNVDK